MDDEALPAGPRAALTALLLAMLATVAALILDPIGSRWAWGAPADLLRWYLTGLGTEATLLQLLGNLALLRSRPPWPSSAGRRSGTRPGSEGSRSPRAPPSSCRSGRSRWAGWCRRWTPSSTRRGP
jgi:hypothetical protein